MKSKIVIVEQCESKKVTLCSDHCPEDNAVCAQVPTGFVYTGPKEVDCPGCGRKVGAFVYKCPTCGHISPVEEYKEE